MTVKELKELIADWPDDDNVLVWDYSVDLYTLLPVDNIQCSGYTMVNFFGDKP